MAASSRRPSRITGRIPGPVVRRESALTRSGEPSEKKMTTTPVPTDKLDAATNVAVNGPADEHAQLKRIVRRLTSSDLNGLLEPDALKRACPVLRGARHSDVPGLPAHSTTLKSASQDARVPTEHQPGTLLRCASADRELAIRGTTAGCPFASRGGASRRARDVSRSSVGEASRVAGTLPAYLFERLRLGYGRHAPGAARGARVRGLQLNGFGLALRPAVDEARRQVRPRVESLQRHGTGSGARSLGCARRHQEAPVDRVGRGFVCVLARRGARGAAGSC